jgi:hypothetical protein
VPVISPNDVLRFALELCLLAALGYWGFAAHDGVVAWVLGVGSPLLAAVVWGTFISPKRKHDVADPGRLLLELAVFGAAVVALFASEQPRWAVVFAGAVAVHLALTFVLHER